MENWEIVSIESELDRLRDEKEKPAPTATATGKKSSFGKMFLYFILGMIIFKLFGELLFIFK
jgi:hypothetical protein